MQQENIFKIYIEILLDTKIQSYLTFLYLFDLFIQQSNLTYYCLTYYYQGNVDCCVYIKCKTRDHAFYCCCFRIYRGHEL